MADGDETIIEPDELGQLLLTLIAEVKGLNLRVGALRALLHDHLGISDAQYDAALARVTAGLQALDDVDGRPKH